MSYYTYILTNKNNSVFYIGVTNNIIARTYQHKSKEQESFTAKYNINKLVYFEEYGEIEEAIIREKKLKRWNKDWKVELIEKMNPNWDDLYKKSNQ
jgi:putative endonuclease